MQGAYDEIALELAPDTGPRIPVLVNARERKNNNGDPTSIAYVIFKSTQRHQYEAELLAVRNKLRALNENLAQKIELEVEQRLTAEGRYNAELAEAQFREKFIAVLGHDLRNPLAGMEAGLKMVLRTPLDEKATNLVSLMQNSVERMNALVSDLTDFARSRMGGGIRLQYKTVQLKPIITHAVNEIAAASPAHNIQLHLDFPEHVECDPMRIAQLVSNLVGNAVSHGDIGGVVKVSGGFQGPILEISVTNRGAAIPSDILERIFQPFIQNATGQARLGLGLGLYISSEIAHAHGGELLVQSDTEETKFIFRMPRIKHVQLLGGT